MQRYKELCSAMIKAGSLQVHTLFFDSRVYTERDNVSLHRETSIQGCCQIVECVAKSFDHLVGG